MLALRAQQALPPAPDAPTWPPGASEPLYEAPCSVNVHVTIAGRQVQVTLRGTDEAEVLTRLEALLARYPVAPPQAQPASPPPLSAAQHNALAMHRPITQTGWCAVHNVAMHWNDGKDGRKGWFSHRTDDGWCKGR
jgi:hypothetical protein